jgi:DNA-binding response OmpR family regulator
LLTPDTLLLTATLDSASSQPGRILVLEDDHAIAQIIAMALGDAGLDRTVVGDGPAAIAAAREEAVGMLLMDMHYPGTPKAEQVVEAVRDSAGADLPVLVMSASNERARAEAMGAYEFLEKPFDLDDLLAAIQRGMDLRQQAQAQAPSA